MEKATGNHSTRIIMATNNINITDNGVKGVKSTGGNPLPGKGRHVTGVA